MKWYEAVIIFAAGVFVGYVVRAVTSSLSVSSSYVVAQGPQTYSNIERWKFIKDEEGRVLGVEVHRRAES